MAKKLKTKWRGSCILSTSTLCGRRDVRYLNYMVPSSYLSHLSPWHWFPPFPWQRPPFPWQHSGPYHYLLEGSKRASDQPFGPKRWTLNTHHFTQSSSSSPPSSSMIIIISSPSWVLRARVDLLRSSKASPIARPGSKKMLCKSCCLKYLIIY